MGYTHYWRHEALTEAGWTALREDVETIVASAAGGDIALAGPLGTDEPKITAGFIALNGAVPADYETFRIDRYGAGFAFCKTQRRPYDVVVATTLLRLARHCPSARLTSDGEPVDWRDAQRLEAALFDDPHKTLPVNE